MKSPRNINDIIFFSQLEDIIKSLNTFAPADSPMKRQFLTCHQTVLNLIKEHQTDWTLPSLAL